MLEGGYDLDALRLCTAAALGALEGRAVFPVTARDSMEAGLTVMAVDEAAARGETIDCAPVWAAYDAACEERA